MRDKLFLTGRKGLISFQFYLSSDKREMTIAIEVVKHGNFELTIGRDEQRR
ncbi:hypothetical protein P0100_02975 [Yersinia pestis]|nr:hypothetical protein [Yersinia pestis]